ncbi:MAG: bifunctional alpha/beta hydrolase/OsmC family protein [Caulobacterales bacterium]|uniref:bifunctional alpha/beta hydrolase/OsmC family protein n=1 Tax=Glycocaulis sp. TaxID=1969725 RepID=UPI003F9EBAEC
MRSEAFEFIGSQGVKLAARLDRPKAPPQAYALFAHCFSCSKDTLAAARIARALAQRGIAVLRFDFTGLGHSEGEFANTNFSSNIDDLIHAADHMRETGQAPSILIGHSLGGAAVVVAAARIPEVKAVVTIGAPADAEHVKHHFADDIDTILKDGEARVKLAGRPFTIRRQFLDDIAGHNVLDAAAALKAALLVAHAPLDETVGIDNATRLFVAAKHPKSFLGLEDADHLLTKAGPAEHAARVIAAWSERYAFVDPLPEPPEAPAGANSALVQETGKGKYLGWAATGEARFLVDEPEDFGGLDAGPAPFQLLSTALAACTTMTLRMYAERKDWALGRITTIVTHRKEVRGEGQPERDVFSRAIRVDDTLEPEQAAKLVEIANKCPVHRTLERSSDIETAFET